MCAAKSNTKKTLLGLLLILVILVGIGLYIFYRAFYYPGIRFPEKSRVIYIHTGWDFDKVLDLLESKHIISNPKTFKIVAGVKGYKEDIKPGKYRIMNGMNNVQLVNLLLSGKQEQETISIHNIRTVQELAGILGYKLEADSATVLKAMLDKQALKKYGFTASTISAMFIPGTYPLLWTDKPEAFIEQMHTNYESFWTDENRKMAAAIPLTPLQVSTLASIVESEQSLHDDEKPIIAGLYINRLKKGIPLQSDPTLVFVRGDFSIMRVRDGDKKIDSPYNTYMYTGLPPGPICMPEPSSLNAVLHYNHNNYIYMCAESDFSHRHHFSTTLKEQEEYAAKYQKALSKRGINR
jgi:UPF0755 protein